MTRELIYLAADGMLMACPLGTREGLVDVGRPRPLFHPSQPNLLRNHFDVAPAGDRLIVNPPVQDELTGPFAVALNWTSTPKQ